MRVPGLLKVPGKGIGYGLAFSVVVFVRKNYLSQSVLFWLSYTA